MVKTSLYGRLTPMYSPSPTTYLMPSAMAFSSNHIKYHLHYSAEYRPERLRRLINSGAILDYLIDLDKAVEEALERQVNKWKVHDQDYLDAVTAEDTEKARGLENMLRLCAREHVFNAMVYV